MMNEQQKLELEKHNAEYRKYAEEKIPQLKTDIITLLALDNCNPIYQKLKDIQFWSQYLRK